MKVVAVFDFDTYHLQSDEHAAERAEKEFRDLLAFELESLTVDGDECTAEVWRVDLFYDQEDGFTPAHHFGSQRGAGQSPSTQTTRMPTEQLPRLRSLAGYTVVRGYQPPRWVSLPNGGYYEEAWDGLVYPARPNGEIVTEGRFTFGRGVAT